MINESGEWVTDDASLKGMVLKIFFEKLHMDEGCLCMGNTLHGFSFVSLTDMDLVTRMVTLEDVRAAIFDMST